MTDPLAAARAAIVPQPQPHELMTEAWRRLMEDPVVHTHAETAARVTRAAGARTVLAAGATRIDAVKVGVALGRVVAETYPPPAAEHPDVERAVAYALTHAPEWRAYVDPRVPARQLLWTLNALGFTVQPKAAGEGAA